MSTTTKFLVAGTQYRERTAIARVAKQSQVNDSVVELEREPGNPYDASAIKVRVDGVWVGYVPREHCRILALRIAEQKRITARLTAVLINVHDDCNPIRFEVQVEVA